jgi:hypothetical protein
MSAPEEEPFLQRWLRRKSEAASGEAPSEEPPEAAASGDPTDGEGAPPDETSVAPSAPDAPVEAEEERPITDADLPDLDELDENSDYSMFMASGVSADKRRMALRKLFQSPKFNVIDGLDDYCEDYTKFDPLGSIVTAEMRHHAERLARKALEGLDGGEDESAAMAAADDAQPPPGPEVAAATPGDEPDAAGASPDESAASADAATQEDRSKTRNG